MIFFRPQSKQKNKEFYEGLVVGKGKNSKSIWGKEARFSPQKVLLSKSFGQYFTPIVIKNLDKSDKVLDIGSGPGTLFGLISPLCEELVGLEIVKSFCVEAKKTIHELGLKNTKIVNGSAEKIPFKNESFDKVVIMDVLHHVENPKLVLKEIRRVLKEKGIAIVYEPNKYNFALFLMCLFDRNEWGALKLGSKSKYKRLFNDLFEIESIEYNGLLIGPDSKLNQSIASFINNSTIKHILGWNNPKIVAVLRKK